MVLTYLSSWQACGLQVLVKSITAYCSEHLFAGDLSLSCRADLAMNDELVTSLRSSLSQLLARYRCSAACFYHRCDFDICASFTHALTSSYYILIHLRTREFSYSVTCVYQSLSQLFTHSFYSIAQIQGPKWSYGRDPPTTAHETGFLSNCVR